MPTSARVVADSISLQGHRITTLEVTMHRFVLAEFNTHRQFSRNSASSRAIPVDKQLHRVWNNPAIPLSWPAEQSGMQGGDELEGPDQLEAYELWKQALEAAYKLVAEYVLAHPDKSTRLHKSVTNRILEPYMWHTVVVTATQWENFWRQRCSPLAQPEMREAAEHMKLAYDVSIPQKLKIGEWHLPYIGLDDLAMIGNVMYLEDQFSPTYTMMDMVMASAARCARVSSLMHDRDKKDLLGDLKLYERLESAEPMHASPLEHPACQVSSEDQRRMTKNFVGWVPWRSFVETRLGKVSTD